MINQWKGTATVCVEEMVTVAAQLPGSNQTVDATVAVPCTFPDGDAVLEFQGLDAVMLLLLLLMTVMVRLMLIPSFQDNMAFDIGMLIALMAAFRICAYLALLAKTYRK